MTRLDKWAYSFTKSCLTKKAYRTAGIAEAVAEKILKERGVTLYCYWCKECGKYHLTKRPPKNIQESNERIF